jgi:hypothetical protein
MPKFALAKLVFGALTATHRWLVIGAQPQVEHGATISAGTEFLHDEPVRASAFAQPFGQNI